eukprot:52474-Eustigmatos_ZCMA.PRE.1
MDKSIIYLASKYVISPPSRRNVAARSSQLGSLVLLMKAFFVMDELKRLDIYESSGSASLE